MTTPERVDLRQVSHADVYVDDDLVGSLVRDSDDTVRFDYLDPAMSPDRGVRDQSVSWSLLRTRHDGPVVTAGGAVPPFFAGLLPEGVRLGVVTSSTKTSADDHLTLLLAIGADTIGNVRMVPAGTTPREHVPMFQPERDDDFRAVYAS